MASDILNPSTPVVLDPCAPEFDGMLNGWPDQDTARSALQAVHRMDLERASVPAVINVTVAGMPGRFSSVVGSGGVSYVPGEPAP
jgi:hypothetical protein